MNSMKRQKDITLEDEFPRLVGAWYTTGEEWRNNSWKNEVTEPKRKQRPVVDMTCDRSKVRFCKEQWSTGIWNLRSVKLVMEWEAWRAAVHGVTKSQTRLRDWTELKQEMARVNISILGMSELKWTRMSEFNSDDHYISYWGQESLRRNEVSLIVNKRVWNTVLGCSLKNDRKISEHFQGKPFSITVIQVYAPTTNAKEDEIGWLYEDLQDLLG